VATVVVLSFNTNLLSLPSALQAFYATMNQKKIIFVSFTTKKKVTATLLPSPSSLRCSGVLVEEEEGDTSFATVPFFFLFLLLLLLQKKR
jgi:hypothetical protein